MRLLFGADGEMRYYLIERPGPLSGLLYARSDAPVGAVIEGQVVGADARHLGWFDGAFLRDTEGFVLAFAEGAEAQGGLALPPIKPFSGRPEPQPLALEPLLLPRPRPAPRWAWSRADLAALPHTRA